MVLLLLPDLGGLSVIEKLRPGDPPSVGPYRLLGRLGAGGMGQVFLARSPGGRLVAVKVIRPELAQEPGFRERFAREIAAAQGVSGVYTAPVVDSDAQAEMPWMATAYVPGPSLAEAVNSAGPWPAGTVLALAAGLAEALAGIHRSGVVHRDLKPSNVLIAADGPRVIDFGVSLAIGRSMLSAAGAVLGSPGYMSPEQASGQRDVGMPTDVFSLGAVLVFAATGSGPFGDDRTPAALLYQVVHGKPDLAGVPARLRPLIERCLAKDPASRPRPADILDLAAGQDGPPTGDWLPQPVVDRIGRFSPATEVPPPFPPAPAAPEPRPGNGGGRWRTWRWPVSGAALLGAGAVLAAILLPSHGSTPPAPTTSHPATPSSPATATASSPATVSASATYASDPLATGSSRVTARVYFGQLKAVVGALAHRVTFNTPAAWVDQEPGKCALTVIFAGVANPTGAVYASGLGPGWRGFEYRPSQDTQLGRLHEQIVTPMGRLSAGQSWQVSAVLVAGNQRLTSDEYTLKFQGGAGAAQTWLIDGHAVSCQG